MLPVITLHDEFEVSQQCILECIAALVYLSRTSTFNFLLSTFSIGHVRPSPGPIVMHASPYEI